MPTINFIWDDVSDNVLVETDENNQVTTTYIRHPEKYGEVFYDKQGNRFSYYHYDGNGSTRKLTGANQAVTKTYIFTGFGELIASPGLGSTPFAYKGAAGYYTNPVTNDIYVRARTYEPTTGRWLSKDPLGFVDGPNLYGAYFVPSALDHSGGYCNGCTVSWWAMNRGECTTHSYRQENGELITYIGEPFENFITFTEPCECCRYQQFVTCNLVVRFFHRGKKVREIILEKKGPFEEDLSDDGVGYGDRLGDETDNDIYSDDLGRARKVACSYYNWDLPRIRIDDVLSKLAPTVTVEFEVDCDFQLKVVDTCLEKLVEAHEYSSKCKLSFKGWKK